MSEISPQAKAAQDSARRQDGKFGNQQHTEATGVSLSSEDPRPISGTSDAAYERFIDEERQRLGSDPTYLKLSNQEQEHRNQLSQGVLQLSIARNEMPGAIFASANPIYQEREHTGQFESETHRRLFAKSILNVTDLVKNELRYPRALQSTPDETAQRIKDIVVQRTDEGSYDRQIAQDLDPDRLKPTVEALHEIERAEGKTYQTIQRRKEFEVRLDAAEDQLVMRPSQRRDVSALRVLPEDIDADEIQEEGFWA